MDAGPGDVVVVGDVNVDVVARHREPVEAGTDTPARITLGGGGSAANTACWLAALGEPVRLVAAVGDDALGRLARADLEAAGVAYAGPVLAGATTGVCMVLVGPDGDRTMLPDRGANDRLAAAPVERAVADPRTGWVHLSGYALLGEGSRPAGLAAVGAARAARLPLSVDAASAAPLRTVGAPTFLDWVTGADVLLANDDELAALGGLDAVVAAVASVVVKHGVHGATWTDGHRLVSVPAVEVDPVDPTGAGDAFAAGWIVARRSGADVDAALASGAVVGARAVTQPGARPPVRPGGRVGSPDPGNPPRDPIGDVAP